MAICCNYCGFPAEEAALPEDTDLYDLFDGHLQAVHGIDANPIEHVHEC